MTKLRQLGMRDDIIKKLRRLAPGVQGIVFDANNSSIPKLEGNVIHKGLSDELYDFSSYFAY